MSTPFINHRVIETGMTGRPAALSLVTVLLAAVWLGGCAGAPKKAQEQAKIDNVRTIKSVRAQSAEATATVSQTEHVTVVQPTSPEKIAMAQAASSDYFAALQLMKVGKLDDALLVLQTIAAQYPTLSGPLVNQGLVYLRQEKWSDALDALDQALKVNARNPYAWNLRGVVLRETGKFQEARQSYERALSIDPLFAKVHFNLGILADLYLQDMKLALMHYERYQALQKKPDPAVGNWIADLRNRLGLSTTAPAAAPGTQTPAPAVPDAG